MLQLPPPLQPMGQYAQFIPYKLVWDPKRNKMNKIPLDYRTGAPGDVQNDPGCWLPFETVASFTDKIGFVFTKNDPFFFPQPIKTIDENYSKEGEKYRDKSLCLWKVSNI